MWNAWLMHADITLDARTRRPALAERAILRIADRLAIGVLDVRMPDGDCLRYSGSEPGPRATIEVRDERLFGRLLRDGALGFAEAYIDGDWDSPDLLTVIDLGARNQVRLAEDLRGSLISRLSRMLVHRLRANSRRGARRNIAAHYDLGNTFYEAWLDPTMAYSAASFRAGNADLELAQHAKFEQMADLAQIGPDQHVLEIGCGWGGFSTWAARTRGCRVTSITLSRAQFDYCQRQIANAGLADRVEVLLRDYRDVEGQFDRIVSIEMLEAVGESHWPAYFRQVHDLLRPGGRASLQVITIDDAHFAAYRRQVDFVQRHVFPGGMLPAPTVLRNLATSAGLAWQSETRDGDDYARTLAHWRRRFDAVAGKVEAEGFDQRFRRFWTYYLTYCEAGFRAGRIDLLRFALCRP